MAKDIDPHTLDQAEGDAHEGDPDKEKGACLWGHDGAYREDWSCSYRWQAHDFSKGDDERIEMHNDPVDAYYKDMPQQIETSGWDTDDSFFPKWYSDEIKRPREPEDWYLEGPKKTGFKPFGGKEVPIDENFKRAYWPYWHNSHHIIPKGTLNSKIEQESTPDVSAHTIRVALLDATYNVNHYHNVVILPQDTEVAWWLELPRHLILKDGNPLDPQGLQQETGNHKKYNDNVSTDLEKALRNFISNVGQNEDCEPEDIDADILKDDLKALQRSCLDQIKEMGSEYPGEPISAIEYEEVFE